MFSDMTVVRESGGHRFIAIAAHERLRAHVQNVVHQFLQLIEFSSTSRTLSLVTQERSFFFLLEWHRRRCRGLWIGWSLSRSTAAVAAIVRVKTEKRFLRLPIMFHNSLQRPFLRLQFVDFLYEMRSFLIPHCFWCFEASLGVQLLQLPFAALHLFLLHESAYFLNWFKGFFNLIRRFCNYTKHTKWSHSQLI